MKILCFENFKKYLLSLFIFLFTINTVSQNMQNKLSQESSLYLKQHSSNPINWFPWGKEALDIAKENDKLIVISVGYSSCHWCHVMEDESFKKNDVADVMNSKFISIKVDREERPDIDEIYMKALVLMTGSGGWPMNIIALPDGTPIWGGTYLPKDNWIEILNQVSQFYSTRKNDVIEYANKVREGIIEESLIKSPSLESNLLQESIDKYAKKAFTYTDKLNGGMGVGQKFPLPSLLNFYLRYSELKEDNEMRSFVIKTLNQISRGGINDRLEGGFHRYTVDQKWHIPHFEKMLYDNAQLMSVFSNAYMVYKDPRYKEELYNIFNFLELKMTSENGLIFSSISADTNYPNGKKIEGDFYIWNENELKTILKNDFTWVKDYYNINQTGLWEEDKYVFYQTISDNQFAIDLGLDLKKFKSKLKEINKKLFDEREKRIQPIIDTKIIFSWNALTIRGLVDAYKATGDKLFLKKALKINSALENYMILNEKIKHTDGEFNKENVLFFEDYSYYIDSLIGLYEATFELDWLNKAYKFSKLSNNEFGTENYFYKFSSNQDLFYSQTLIQLQDGVIPSANSVMNFNLFRLSHYIGERDFFKVSQKMISNMSGKIEERVTDHMFWLWLSLNYSNKFYEFAICGQKAKEKSQKLSSYYLPNSVIAASNKASEMYLLKGRFIRGETNIYVCVDNTCKFPVKTVDDALELID